MKNNLQNQLLKAGLAKKQQTAKKKQPKVKKSVANTPTQPIEDLRSQQMALDKAKNKAIQDAKQHKERNAQIRQIVQANPVTQTRRSTPYYYIQNNKVLRIYVNEKQRIELAIGALGITYFEGSVRLLPQKALEKIRQRGGEDFIVVCNRVASLKDYYDLYPGEEDYIWPSDYEW